MFVDGGLADTYLFCNLAVLQPLTVVHPEYTAGLWRQFCLDELLVLLVGLFLISDVGFSIF